MNKSHLWRVLRNVVCLDLKFNNRLVAVPNLLGSQLLCWILCFEMLSASRLVPAIVTLGIFFFWVLSSLWRRWWSLKHSTYILVSSYKEINYLGTPCMQSSSGCAICFFLLVQKMLAGGVDKIWMRISATNFLMAMLPYPVSPSPHPPKRNLAFTFSHSWRSTKKSWLYSCTCLETVILKWFVILSNVIFMIIPFCWCRFQSLKMSDWRSLSNSFKKWCEG